MTAAPAGKWCCRTVELAARVLPTEYRHRYALEFVAELYGMSRLQQRKHAAQVLSRSWALRAALTEVAPGRQGEALMNDVKKRPLLCWLNVNHRYRWASTEDGDRYLRCTRCGKDCTPRDYRNTIGL
jgi:uncharacterized protein (DUF2249 family)